MSRSGADYVRKLGLSINVRDFGARGDGVTDDRPAVQAALDFAGIGGSVYFPPGVYALKTATLPGVRILRTYQDQTLYGAGRYTSTLLVGASFGDYAAVIGALDGSTYTGRWNMTGLGIDQNAAAGNALNIAAMGTYPRFAVYLGSYVAGSSVTITDCACLNGDSVNAAYVYADTIDVSRTHFLAQGGPVGTGNHDHSTIYTTTTVPGGTQSIVGNSLRGVLGSGGARTAIETHGGTQTIVGNSINGYVAGMNLTGINAINSATDGITCTGNAISGVCTGIHLWSQYSAALPSGTAMRNVVIAANAITLDRDAWNGIAGFLAYACGVLVDPGNTAPIDGLTIDRNLITYLPSVTAPPASDYRSSGISLDLATVAAEIRNLHIGANTIISPLSAGMNLSATIRRGAIVANKTVNPGQSTDASVTGVANPYRSGCIVGRTLADVIFESNLVVDTLASHLAEYNIYGNPTAATNCIARNQVTRYADGVGARCGYFPPVNTAGAELYIEEASPAGALPSFNTKVGSRVTATNTGKVVVQTTAAVGTGWKVALALGATTGVTSPAAGGAGALPATPAGYITVNINGTDRQIPYY